MKYIDKDKFLIILLSSAFISISLFELLIILFLLWEFYLIFKRKIKINGIFTIPLFLIMIPSIASTIIYGKLKDLAGVLNQNFFFVSYFAKNAFNPSYELFRKLNLVIVFFSFLEIFVVIFNFIFKHTYKPIWGGTFEIGIIFSLGSISAFVLFLLEKDKKKKFVFLSLALFFAFLVFWTGKRNPILGLISIYLITFIKLYKLFNINKKIIFYILILFIVIFSFGISYAIYKFPKYKTIVKIITLQASEEEINKFSSNRWYIGKRGIEVIKKDIENKNIVPLLIGHGYNSGYYLDPPSPVGRTYESIFLISEFIQKGILGLLGIIFMMFVYFKYIFSLKIKNTKQFVAFSFAVFPTYFFVGGIFSGIWDAILPLYFLLFGLSEKYYGEKRV